MVVASGPDYPYGNFDPTPEIAALAKKWGIGCHSDCCLGSFINPFAEKAGFKQTHYVDFRIPGVTSISVDPHKYGLGPKGVSVCLFRDSALRSHQFFATMSWNGGFYGTPVMAGSRPGNVVAGTWAAMMKIGESGYFENAKLILTACSKLRKAIMAEIPEVVVGTRDNTCVVSIVQKSGPNSINPIALCDVVEKQYHYKFGTLQNPAGLHISMTIPLAQEW